jgi:signal transduction histidine kinase
VVLDAEDEAWISGSQESLAILLCNLLINAFRYATAGSAVDVHLRAAEVVELAIANDCEPLSAQEFGRICERFYRAPGSAGQGAGLGLSIVARIAQHHNARMSVGPLESRRGFQVRLEFDAPGFRRGG